MAIYRCELKSYSRASQNSATAAAAYVTGSKVKGKAGTEKGVAPVSAVAAAAYRSAESLEAPGINAETGKAITVTHDYTHKRGVLWSGIMAPEGAPAWARDRGQLWNKVEAAEKRKDAQIFRECLVSIPRELSPEAGQKLVQEFVKAELVSKGMIADIGIHSPRASDNELNPHAHIMLTTRQLDGDKFAAKKEAAWSDIRWKSKGIGNANENGFLMQLRAAWADACNKALAEEGEAARVDHRSLADQGIDRLPQTKLGKAHRARPDQDSPNAQRWRDYMHGRAEYVRSHNDLANERKRAALVQCGRKAGRVFFRHNLAVGAEMAEALRDQIDAERAKADTVTLHIIGHGPGRPEHDIWGDDDGGPGVG